MTKENTKFVVRANTHNTPNERIKKIEEKNVIKLTQHNGKWNEIKSCEGKWNENHYKTNK